MSTLDASEDTWRYEPAYRRYVESVSTDEMAISPELSRVAENMLRATRARLVLDLGSGFSSYLFRVHFRDANVDGEVFSVDDDPAWLEETRRFLASEDVPARNLLTIEAIERIGDREFDLVLYDLGRMPTRTNWLARVLDYFVAPRTSLLVDDVHKLPYRRQVADACKRRNLKLYSLRAFTRDRYGRYAALVLG